MPERPRMFRGGPAAMGFSCALAAVLTAAGTAAAAEQVVNNPDTFVYAIIGDIDSLDPHWQYDGNSHEVMWQTYETLIGYRGASIGEFEPLLASHVPSKANTFISPDGRTYTFPIRKGVRFHDGATLTPEDVKYSLMRFMLMDRAGGASALLLEPLLGVHSTRSGDYGKPIEGLFEAADRAVRAEGNAVVLRLREPYAPLLHILASFCPVVSKAWTVSNGGWDGKADSWTRHNNPAKENSHLHDHVNGTGPFTLERWDRKEKRLVLVRNESYRRRPAALKRIVYRTVDEFSTRKLMLQAGDADAVILERQFLPQVAGLAGVAVDDDLPLLETHNAFVFNFKIDPEANPHIGSGELGEGIPPDFFTDPDVRRGFAHAFDYDAYILDGYRGKGTRARGPIPPGVPGHNPRQPVIAHDLLKAAEYLRKAWDGKVWEYGFRLTLTYMQGRADRQLACSILKTGIESLNPRFHVDVRGIQWSSFLDSYVGGKLPLINARWALDYPDAHNAVHPFLHSRGYYAKAAGYSNPRADRLIDSALGELDPDRRRSLYRELQQIAWEDLPAIFTLDTYYLRVRRAWISGWEYNPMLMYGYLYPVHKGQSP